MRDIDSLNIPLARASLSALKNASGRASGSFAPYFSYGFSSFAAGAVGLVAAAGLAAGEGALAAGLAGEGDVLPLNSLARSLARAFKSFAADFGSPVI